jgi:hypothetical protein
MTTLVLVLLLVAGCGPSPRYLELQRQLMWIDGYCGVDQGCRIERRNAAIMAYDAVDGPYRPAPVAAPAVGYQPAPVQRPYVVLPGQSNFPLQPGLLPGTFYQPGPGGPRWYNIQQVP